MATMPMQNPKPEGHQFKDRYTDPWGPKSPRDYIKPSPHTTTSSNIAPVTITTLFPQFNRWAIGFDPLLQTFTDVSREAKTSGYPPYNIYKKKDTYVLELAVAGFAKEDIAITVKELLLTVQGELEVSQEEPIHKGIATRDFKQEFVLAEYVNVNGAELKDGLLRITLEQVLPEEKKPKIITVM